MDISVIIVNWNSAQYLKKCLASIINLKEIKFEIIVVDNASYDGCDEIIKREFPGAIFVQSERNLGFAKANNMGVTWSSGRNLLFLNPDTEVLGSAISLMLDNLESLPDAGAIGCKLLNSDLSLQTSCIQPFPTVLNQLFDVEYLKMKTPGLSFWGIRSLFSNSGNPEEVQVVSGACVMVKRDVYEKIEGFSEDYFIYAEDIDLCYKIKCAGYKSYYIKDAEVIHYGGGSSDDIDRTYFGTVLMRESVFIFLKKTRGEVIAQSYKFSMMVSSVIRLTLMKILVVLFKREYIRKTMKKWKRVLRWAIGLEKRELASVLKKDIITLQGQKVV